MDMEEGEAVASVRHWVVKLSSLCMKSSLMCYWDQWESLPKPQREEIDYLEISKNQ